MVTMYKHHSKLLTLFFVICTSITSPQAYTSSSFPSFGSYSRPTYSATSSYSVRDQVKQEARNYLNSHSSFSEYTIPSKLKPEYDLKINDIVEELSRQTTVYNHDVKDKVRRKIGSFVNTLNSIVLNYDVDKKVNDIIDHVAYSKGAHLGSMQSYMRPEFNRKKDMIINKIRRDMNNDGRNYVRKSEIEKLVKKEMNSFFYDVNNSRWGSSTSQHRPSSSSNDSGWFNSVVDSFSSIFSSGSASEPKLKNDALEEKVLDAAYDIIGLTPDQIPARVVSDFGDKIKKAIRRLKNMWSVTNSDIRRVTREELQSILNKISYKDENCSICLCEYSSGERIATLSCGHVYHEGCIKQWLNTDANKTCPLCRAAGVIISRIENVPY